MTTGALIGILVIAIALIFIMGGFSPRGRRKNVYKRERVVSADTIKRKWQEVEEMMTTGRPSSLRAAIIEADKLLAASLNARGYSGDFVAKMRRASGSFSNLDGVWSAHKFRNRLVHEVAHDFFVSEAKAALAEYKRALKDLGVL